MTQESVLERAYHAWRQGPHADRNYWGQLARIHMSEHRQRRGSQYARDHAGEPGRNGGIKGC